MTAIADAMGVDVSELDDLGLDEAMTTIDHDLTDPRAAMDAVERAILDGRPPEGYPKAQPGESTQAYKVREGNWRERHGMARKRKSVPPSRKPEARRTRHLQGLVDAGKYADLATAEAMVQRRGGNGTRKRHP